MSGGGESVKLKFLECKGKRDWSATYSPKHATILLLEMVTRWSISVADFSVFLVLINFPF